MSQLKEPIRRPLRIEFTVLGVACAVLAILVKMVWRPHYVGGGTMGLLLGVAPNFCYGLGEPLLTLGISQGRISVRDAIGLAAAMIVYEFLQLFIPGRSFDPWDIVATAIGISLFYAYYRWRR